MLALMDANRGSSKGCEKRETKRLVLGSDRIGLSATERGIRRESPRIPPLRALRFAFARFVCFALCASNRAFFFREQLFTDVSRETSVSRGCAAAVPSLSLPLRSHSPVPSFGYAIMTRASKRRKQPRRKRASEAHAAKTGRSIASARRAEKRRRGRGRRRGVVAGCRCGAALLGCVREGVLRRDAAEYQAFGHVAASFVVVAPDGTELAG